MIRKLCYSLLLCLAATPALASESVLVEAGMTHRMMMLVIQLGIILFAARLGNILFEKLRLPGVLGELCAGLLIGPYALGAISFPGFREGLFPVYASFPVSPELYGICTVASIVLLFVVGLETDIKLFMRYSVVGSLVGIGGAAVSFAVGDATAVLLYPVLFGREVGPMAPVSILLGVISAATSVGITARVLSERRKLDSPEGVTILAGAVIDDVLGIVLLAIGMGIISASKASGSIDWGHIGVITVKAVGIWLSATILGLLASRRIGVLLKLFRDRSAIAIMALGLALILAGLFEESGLAMIIGSYVMGLSLSRTDINHVIREKLEPIYAFLVPVFFTVMGMLVDLRMLASGKVLVFGLIYTAGAALAKMLGAGLPAMVCNFNARGAFRIGAGMMPRGEVALIIAGIGLSAGLISSEVFGVGVMMTLITTLVAPSVLVFAFRSSAPGTRKSEPEEETGVLHFEFPSKAVGDVVFGALEAIFESEGFFVHCLDHRERLYQLRKDSMVIGFRHSGTEIIFQCGPSEIAFVNAAMFEVMAELEQTMAELRKPFDRSGMVKGMQDEGENRVGGRSLAAYVSRKTLIPKLKATDKKGAIDELVNALAKHGFVGDAEEARNSVWEREQSMSTGMQYGIAIPHGRTSAVSRLVCAVGIKREGIDFDSIDGEPTRIVVLTLSPKDAAAPHVQFMSTVSQTLDEEGRKLMLTCDSSQEMYDVLTGSAEKRKRRVDAASAVRKLLHREKKKPGLGGILRTELMLPDLQGSTKEEVIREMISAIEGQGCISDADKVLEAISVREDQMSTGMTHGVAIPHARTGEVKDLVCAVGVKKTGVEFDSLDKEPARIIVLTLSPEDKPAPHIQFMAMISRALDEQGRKKVLAAKTPSQVKAALISKE